MEEEEPSPGAGAAAEGAGALIANLDGGQAEAEAVRGT
eukprot:COSAG01_NODE_7018_length_3391_cov_2.202309_5_plen_38_part_00